MKAFRTLLLALALPAITLKAEEASLPPKAAEPALPSAKTSTTDLTPAKDVPITPPANPGNRPVDLMPAQDVPAIPPPAEPGLIPETPATTEKPAGSAIEQPKTSEKEKKNKTEASADALAARVRYRSVKTRALKDSAVQAEWDRAEAAHTDWEKRDALKKYYSLLFARMEKIDHSLKTEIVTRRATSVHRLDQVRLDPTEKPVGEVRASR